MSLFNSYFEKTTDVATTSLQDQVERNTPDSTAVGPIGDNILTFDKEGYILSSGLKNFIIGNTIWDYMPEKYHTQIWAIIESLPEIRRQPIIFDFEVLFQGHYHPRRAEAYYSFEYGYLIRVEDIPVDSNIIDYAELPSETENEFIVARNGLILGCRYPERTINNPVGLNVFDTLLPQYIPAVREAMRKVLHTRIEMPIEYEFELNGKRRYKAGTIRHHGGNAIFRVKRIAKPQKPRDKSHLG